MKSYQTPISSENLCLVRVGANRRMIEEIKHTEGGYWYLPAGFFLF